MTPDDDWAVRTHVPRTPAARDRRAGWLPLAAVFAPVAFALGAYLSFLLPWPQVTAWLVAASGKAEGEVAEAAVLASPRRADERRDRLTPTVAELPRDIARQSRPAVSSGDMRAFLLHAFAWLHGRPPRSALGHLAHSPTRSNAEARSAYGSPSGSQAVQHAATSIVITDTACASCAPPPAP